MVWQYAWRSEQGNTDPNTLMQAIALVSAGEKIRVAARAFDICHVTLACYVRKTMHESKGELVIGYATPWQVFNDEQETELEQNIKEAASIYLTPWDVRQLAYDWAKAFHISMPPSLVANKAAGSDWLSAFLKWHSSLTQAGRQLQHSIRWMPTTFLIN